jgi:Tfp pilus assembly protein PilF
LAKAYLQINEFDKAEDILKKIAKQFPDSNLAQFGMAQLKYKKGKAYKSTLDKIWKRDPLVA